MEIALPLDKMTVSDKFKILEEIWDSLKRTPKDVPVPAWHADVLWARQASVGRQRGQDGIKCHDSRWIR